VSKRKSRKSVITHDDNLLCICLQRFRVYQHYNNMQETIYI